MKTIRIAIGLLLLLPNLAQAAGTVCKSQRPIVGPCFSVHGRMHAYNGNPTLRIWPLGSHRLLGVEDNNGDPEIPDAVNGAFHGDAFVNIVTADYRICPVSKRRAGAMQFVCVIGASHIAVTKGTPYAR
jgi:hypothetical protein